MLAACSFQRCTFALGIVPSSLTTLACCLLQGTAVVGLQLGTQQPLFALIVAGDNIYAASGSTALLQVLLLFLRLCQLELGGSLGGRHIQHLELSHVLKQHRWGGLACQPECASGLAMRSMVWGGVRQMERACPAGSIYSMLAQCRV